MKILAVASGGGHWIELLRLQPVFEGHHVTYVSTNMSFADTVKHAPFYQIPDVSRWDKLKHLVVACKLLALISKVKPDIIITTGAAPGVLSVLMGKLKGVKTIYIESMCHIEGISMSGKITSFFADRVYTQWPELANAKFTYAGNVMF